MEDKNQLLEMDKEQLSNWERGTSRLYIVTLLGDICRYMQSTSCEMLGWMNHKLESRSLGEIPTNSDRQLM